MKRRLIALCVLLGMLFPFVLQAKDRMLQGRVMLVGEHDELNPAVGQDVQLLESGDTVRTKEGGKFRIFTKDVFKPGAKITLAVERKDWRIQYPLDGETRVPDDLEKELVEIRLLPIGSKKFWSADRFEKFIAGIAAKSREQVRPEGRPQEIEFSRYIKDWGIKYGFSAQQARDEIDKWVDEAEQGNDPYQLGLAAFARKNFREAGNQFQESGENKVKASAEATAKGQRLLEEAIRDFRLSGDAKYSNYQFLEALKSYLQAEQLVSKEKEPQLWAAIQIDIGKAGAQIGTRTQGSEIHGYLDDAATAFRAALTVYTKEQLPQDWAMTQNNLGVALWTQGTRTTGETGTQLLADAASAYRAALTVRTEEHLPQDWAATQNNLGLVLEEQGNRTGGEPGIRLLAEAVSVYRDALTVYTKGHLPQGWALIQNSLGNILQAQGSRTGGEPGIRLLAEAVSVYRDALTVYTKEHLPQGWAATQNNLGNALQARGIRTSGEAGIRLLGEAVSAYRDALTVRTKEHLPQDWAATQHNLGIVLKEQASRIDGEAGIRLLGEAVMAHRAAVTVRTKEHLPQDWAATQHSMGIVLWKQASRTGGEAGIRLLGEAVVAYRAALTVRTKEHLPQDWATIQNHLGVALQEQGSRTGGEAGKRLLGEAVATYRDALTVYTKEQLPQDWAATQNNLAKALLNLEDWRGAAEAYHNLSTLYPDYEKYSFTLYQEKLFAYPEAFALIQRWLERQPDDLSAQANFAEAHFTTGRFEEAQTRIAALLANPQLDSSGSLALRTLQVATLLVMNKPELATTAFAALHGLVKNLPSDFDLSWDFEGSRHFIGKEASLVGYRAWLLDLFSAVEEKDAQKRLRALNKLQTPLSSGLNP